ncbi:MAG: hypothetical protein LBV54_06850 [Puniceicoccales bacterium]|nr:hypothetical protein [Puniceicoccales bacterium]
MIYGFLSILGRLLAALPEGVPAALSRVLGWMICHCLPERAYVLASNLHHAFPDKPEAWRKRISLESCRRTVEMGLFVLASPYFSEARIRSMFTSDPKLLGGATRLDQEGMPGVVLTPHFSLMESLTLIRAVEPELRADLDVGVFYRPFSNSGLERWVKATRERFGIRLLSRRDGFSEASEILRRNGRVGVLFDQHTGRPGSLSLFMGRLVSTSELAGLLAEKHKAGAFVFYARRTGFWRGVLMGELLTTVAQADRATVTIAANIWLENKLRSGDNACADWLWLHKRWKVAASAKTRFAINLRRDIMKESLEAAGLAECPRNERFWVRLPGTMRGVVQCIPLLQTLRTVRPDAALTLFAQKAFVPFLEQLRIAEKVITLPQSGGLANWRFFRRLRGEYPDTYLVLEQSLRADIEAWLTGTPQRFGICPRHTWRPLLTHAWAPPKGAAHTAHLLERWLQKAHGLAVPLDFSPLRPCGGIVYAPAQLRVSTQAAGVAHGLEPVGLVCSTDTRRWPVEHWRTLILRLLAEHPEIKIRLLGGSRDKTFAASVAASLPEDAVENLAGETDWAQFARAVGECRCAVGCDSSAMHVANMLGVPTVWILEGAGRASIKPVFTAPVAELQPPAGSAPGAAVSPEHVWAACETLLVKQPEQPGGLPANSRLEKRSDS